MIIEDQRKPKKETILLKDLPYGQSFNFVGNKDDIYLKGQRKQYIGSPVLYLITRLNDGSIFEINCNAEIIPINTKVVVS